MTVSDKPDTGTKQTEKSEEFSSAKRKQESLLAPMEKKVLIWLAQRMPSWINCPMSPRMPPMRFVDTFWESALLPQNPRPVSSLP